MYEEDVGRKKEEEKEEGKDRAQRKLKALGKMVLPVTTSLQRIPESSKKDGSVRKGRIHEPW